MKKRGITKEEAYILGVLCGDGYIVKKTNRIELQVKDKDFIEFFDKCFQKKFNRTGRIRKRKDNGLWAYSLYSKEIVKSLSIYNEKCKTKEWRVPKEVINGNDKIKGFYLRGLFDSEGHISNNLHNIEFVSTNFNALKDLKKLLDCLKINYNVSFRTCKIKDYTFNGYKIRIFNLYNLLNFKKEIGFSIKRKQKRLNKFINKALKRRLEYIKAMKLNKEGLGSVKISKLLNLPEGRVHAWLYENKLPHIIRDELNAK